MIKWKNVPLCDECWKLWHPERAPVRLRPEHTTDLVCAYCDHLTGSSIFVRVKVEFPEEAKKA